MSSKQDRWWTNLDWWDIAAKLLIMLAALLGISFAVVFLFCAVVGYLYLIGYCK